MPRSSRRTSSFVLWVWATIVAAFPGAAQSAPQAVAQSPSFFTAPDLPPPNGVYVTPQAFHAAYANGVIIQNISHKRFTEKLAPPPLGQSRVHQFGSTVEFDQSSDNGRTFSHLSAPAQVRVIVNHTGNQGTTGIYDTEMLQLDIAGGGLPPGVMLRESPTLKSRGQTKITALGAGAAAPVGYQIDSFFDIFTELSVDGGATWLPADRTSHVELTIDPTTIPPVPAPTPLLPPPNDRYITPALFHALYANGIVIRNIRHQFFTQSLPPPSLEKWKSTCEPNVCVRLSPSSGGGSD